MDTWFLHGTCRKYVCMGFECTVAKIVLLASSIIPGNCTGRNYIMPVAYMFSHNKKLWYISCGEWYAMENVLAPRLCFF